MGHEEKRRIKGSRGESKTGGGVTLSCRNRRKMAAAVTNSSEQIRQPGGISRSGKGGKIERRTGAL
jgi:hypothetical protein